MRQLLEKLESMLDVIDTLEARKQKMMEFMDLCPAICFIKDTETGRYIYVNDSFKQFSGQEVIGRTDSEIFPLDDALRWIAHDLQVIKAEEPIQTIETLRTPAGQKAFLVAKFIIVNGGKYLGGIAMELPDTITIRKPKTGKDGPDDTSTTRRTGKLV